VVFVDGHYGTICVEKEKDSAHFVVTIFEPIPHVILECYYVHAMAVLRSYGWLKAGEESSLVKVEEGAQLSVIPARASIRQLKKAQKKAQEKAQEKLRNPKCVTVTFHKGDCIQMGRAISKNSCGVIAMLEMRAMVDPSFDKLDIDEKNLRAWFVNDLRVGANLMRKVVKPQNDNDNERRSEYLRLDPASLKDLSTSSRVQQFADINGVAVLEETHARVATERAATRVKHGELWVQYGNEAPPARVLQKQGGGQMVAVKCDLCKMTSTNHFCRFVGPSSNVIILSVDGEQEGEPVCGQATCMNCRSEWTGEAEDYSNRCLEHKQEDDKAEAAEEAEEAKKRKQEDDKADKQRKAKQQRVDKNTAWINKAAATVPEVVTKTLADDDMSGLLTQTQTPSKPNPTAPTPWQQEMTQQPLEEKEVVQVRNVEPEMVVEPRNVHCDQKFDPRDCDARPFPDVSEVTYQHVGEKTPKDETLQCFWFGAMLFCYSAPPASDAPDVDVEALWSRLFIPVRPKTAYRCASCRCKFMNNGQWQGHMERNALTEICPQTDTMVVSYGAAAHYIHFQVVQFLHRLELNKVWENPLDLLDACRIPQQCGGVAGKNWAAAVGKERNKEHKTLKDKDSMEALLAAKSEHLWKSEIKAKSGKPPKVGEGRDFGIERFEQSAELMSMGFLLPAKRWPETWKTAFYKNLENNVEKGLEGKSIWQWAWHSS
jgi:hypothetical protein